MIRVEAVLPHENAERLEIIPVGAWQAVVKKGQFRCGDRAIYIEPDYTVPTSHPEFSFLAKEGRDRHRLKAVRLRGALSFGLLIPLPDELKDREVGANVMADLGIERYEPPVKLAHSDELPQDQWPQIYSSQFDVEALQKFPNVLELGEPVVVTEEIHGANARYLWHNGVFYMGSRRNWLKPEVMHSWRRAVDNDPGIIDWCSRHPGVVLYGEIFGAVQSLKYGSPKDIRFAAFAASDKGEWWDTDRLLADETLVTVPIVYRGAWDPELVLPMAEHDSAVPRAETGHMREGIVIVPERERRDSEMGRVAVKHISNRYWESAA